MLVTVSQKKKVKQHYVQALLKASIGFRLNAAMWELEFEAGHVLYLRIASLLLWTLLLMEDCAPEWKIISLVD